MDIYISEKYVLVIIFSELVGFKGEEGKLPETMLYEEEVVMTRNC